MGNKMQTYKQCSIKLEIGVNGVISQPAILGSIQSEALIQFLGPLGPLVVALSVILIDQVHINTHLSISNTTTTH